MERHFYRNYSILFSCKITANGKIILQELFYKALNYKNETATVISGQLKPDKNQLARTGTVLPSNKSASATRFFLSSRHAKGSLYTVPMLHTPVSRLFIGDNLKPA
jgi:hypothetical protein